MRAIAGSPGSVPAWWKTSDPGTCAPVPVLISLMFERSMPIGASASLTRISTVFPIEHAAIGAGAGSDVGGVVETTNGAPGVGSPNGDWHEPIGQPQVSKHVIAAFLIGAPPTVSTCGELPPCGTVIW